MGHAFIFITWCKVAYSQKLYGGGSKACIAVYIAWYIALHGAVSKHSCAKHH